MIDHKPPHANGSFQQPFLRSLTSAIGKTTVLLPTTFVTVVGISSVNFGILFFMRSTFAASPSLIGWFSSCYLLCYLLGCLLLRPLGKTLKPRFSLVFATVGMAATLAGILLSRTLALAFILYGAFGVSVSLFFPPLIAWLSIGLEDKKLNTAIMRFNLSWSGGAIVAPYLGGILTELDVKYPLLLGIGLSAVSALAVGGACIYIAKNKVDAKIAGERQTESAAPYTNGSTYLRFVSWVGALSVYVAGGVFWYIFPLFGRDSLAMSESRIGVVLLSRTLFTTIGFILLGRFTRWHFNKTQILTTQVLCAGVILAMSFVSSFLWYVILAPFFGLLISLAYSNSIFHGISGSVDRGKRTAIHEALLTAGQIVGSVGGGQLYQAFSMKAAYLFCVACLGAGAMVQVLLILSAGKRGEAVRA